MASDDKNRFSWRQQRLRPTATQLVSMLALTFLLFVTQTESKFCTSLKIMKPEVNQYGQKLCTESYQSRCGWFTFKMCTYYEKIPCTKERNDTKVKFKVVTECCKGYMYDENNITCIRDPATAKTIQDPDDDDDGINISHGAFAAIASACLFIICVTVVIVIHVRKKQLKEEKAKEAKSPLELEKMVQA
ncbi:uncharacterized protein [Haliotis asinina]|uniref:uncharacterized protein isoform X4 n=1 Tax=Haliotis asinina TaxID=109174 RepID=UPI0035325F53